MGEKGADEESGMPYVKPPPKPKPMSLSIQPGLSWMLMLLLVSGGFFLWRRSRNRNTAPRAVHIQKRHFPISCFTEEEIDAEAVVERLTENQTEAHLSQRAFLLSPHISDPFFRRGGARDARDDARG